MRVFVYGTLTDSGTAASVLDSYEFGGPATCSGLHRVDGEYPTLLPGGEVSGRLLQTPDSEALDRYEGVDRGLYVRVSLSWAEGGSVDTYVGDPARLGVDESWPGNGPFPDRVRSYLDAHDVTVTLDAA
jgi:gamma-glutamylaminecyclotransferase